MRREDQQKAGTVIVSAIAIGIVMLTMLLLCGCATKHVPVESVRTEYREADTMAIYNRLLKLFESRREKETRSDSLIDRQKETVVLKENGDTARHDRERIVYRATNRERELESKVKEQDSTINDLRMQLTSIKADSIQIPYPVERTLTRWEKIKMDFGGMAIGGLLAVVCVAVVWLIMKYRK